jgi:hypothetical protein
VLEGVRRRLADGDQDVGAVLVADAGLGQPLPQPRADVGQA